MKKEDVEAREKRLHTLLIDLSKDVQIEQESSYKRYLKRLHEIYDISDNDIYRHSIHLTSLIEACFFECNLLLIYVQNNYSISNCFLVELDILLLINSSSIIL